MGAVEDEAVRGEGCKEMRADTSMMGMKHRALVSLLATLLVPGFVSAQRPPPPDSLPVRMDSLVVTILRTPLPLGRTPFSIGIMEGSLFGKGLSGLSLEEALHGLPGIQLQNRYNFAVGERLSIRGFGGRAQFGVRGVKIFLDDIPATLPDGQSTLDHLDPRSLGRAELLRGPASALYGNASGGVLRLETRHPEPVPIQAEATGIFGSHGLQRLEVGGGGLHDGVGYRFDFASFGYDGFRTNPIEPSESYGGAQRRTLRGQLRVGLAGGDLKIHVNLLDLEAENPGSITSEQAAGGTREANPGNVRQGTRKEIDQGQIGARWTKEVGGMTGTIAAYGIARSVVNPIPPRVIDLDRFAGGVHATLRGEGRGGLAGLRWFIGGEVDLQADDRLNFENRGGEAGRLVLDQRERVRAIGAFVNADLALPGPFGAMGTLRFDHHSFEVRDRFPTMEDPDDSGSLSLSALSPSLGLHAAATRSLDLFGSLSTTFQTPTTTEFANRPGGAGGFNPDLKAQEGITAELGGRGTVGGGGGAHARYEVAVFRSWVRNQLVPFELPETPGRTFYRNSGSSKHRGLEGALLLLPWAGVSAQLGYTYLDPRFEEYEEGGVSYDGNRIPGLASHHAEGRLRVSGSTPSGAWFAEVEGEYVGQVTVDDANANSSPAYGLLDLRVGASGLSLLGLRISPFLGISNLLGKEHYSSVTVNAFGRRYFEPGPGRAFHLGLVTSWRPG